MDLVYPRVEQKLVPSSGDQRYQFTHCPACYINNYAITCDSLSSLWINY